MNMINRRHFLGELIGTFMLVFFGCGAVAVTVLFSSHVGLFQVAVIWGFAVTLAIYATRHLSCAHLNPAVSLAMAVSKRMNVRLLPRYWIAQFLGAFLAAAVLYGLFASSIAHYESVNGIMRGTHASVATAKMFGEYYPNVTTLVAFTAEAVGTFLLVFLIFSLTEGCNVGRPDDALTPFFIGMTVMTIICIIAPLTQAALNPARDLSPRLLAWLAGWGKAAFPDEPWGFLEVYVFGPFAGGLAASWVFTKVIQPLMANNKVQAGCKCLNDRSSEKKRWVTMQIAADKLTAIKDYYGKILKSKKDLKTDACCSPDSFPEYLRKIMEKIDDEIIEKFYGCGSPIPPGLEGRAVVDLGCGTGRDVYLVSALVGQEGHVIGVDMTDEQIMFAQKHLEAQTKRFGYSYPNMEFKQGYIENLQKIGVENNSVDVVISNCVINLSPDKKTVFEEIFRVLKRGGELYFSDIFAGRRLPEHLQADPVLLGECLGGALYIEDFRRLLREIGCLDYRVVSKRKVNLNNPEVETKVGMVDFYSMTIRAFKLETLEDICEDYGQVATYLGTIPECPHQFILDDHHIFQTGRPMLVCGNTASMLSETRYGQHFKVLGDRRTHFGKFPCGPSMAKTEDGDSSTSCKCI
ncbi:MAG: MIP family channel protein [Deltaproteobacteria bacterium]|nr:MIP family channel protein [Deltaproteobacteria bacterium]